MRRLGRILIWVGAIGFLALVDDKTYFGVSEATDYTDGGAIRAVGILFLLIFKKKHSATSEDAPADEKQKPVIEHPEFDSEFSKFYEEAKEAFASGKHKTALRLVGNALAIHADNEDAIALKSAIESEATQAE